MPSSCSADYCTNSKGFQMCRFPKDPNRREIWLQNMNRANWLPSRGARLCAVS